MNCSTAGWPDFHCLPEFPQTHVHWVFDAIQLSHPSELGGRKPNLVTELEPVKVKKKKKKKKNKEFQAFLLFSLSSLFLGKGKRKTHSFSLSTSTIGQTNIPRPHFECLCRGNRMMYSTTLDCFEFLIELDWNRMIRKLWDLAILLWHKGCNWRR